MSQEEHLLTQILEVLKHVSAELNELKHTVRGISAAHGNAAREGETKSRAVEEQARQRDEMEAQRVHHIRKIIRGMKGQERGPKFQLMVSVELRKEGHALRDEDNKRWNLDGTFGDVEDDEEEEWPDY